MSGIRKKADLAQAKIAVSATSWYETLSRAYVDSEYPGCKLLLWLVLHLAERQDRSLSGRGTSLRIQYLQSRLATLCSVPAERHSRSQLDMLRAGAPDGRVLLQYAGEIGLLELPAVSIVGTRDLAGVCSVAHDRRRVVREDAWHGW